MIRVLIVDDSLTVRRWVSEIIAEHPDIEVIAEATNGREAIASTEKLKPDIIIMDMAMPHADGVYATRQIMAYHPTPIIILSGAQNRSANLKVVDALRAGALEAVDMPFADENVEQWKREFLSLLFVAARMKVVRHISASLPTRRPKRALGSRVKLIVVGASTGGPRTVANLLGNLCPLTVPLLLVLHFPNSLFEEFVSWLASVSSMPVVPARDGASLKSLKGTVSIAIPDRHVIVSGGRIAIVDGAPRNFCKPSVDTLFESAAESFGDGVVAVLLSGMGEDGAEGMLKIRQVGGRTIAQDESTCAVFGMPKAAIDLGVVDQVLPDREIANAIMRLCRETECVVPQ